MSGSNWLDISILLLLLIAFFKGFRSGFFKQAFSIVGLFFGLYLALIYFENTAQYLSEYIPFDIVPLQIIAFILITLIVAGLFSLGGLLLFKLRNLLLIKLMDNLLGALFGLLKGAGLVYLLLLLIKQLPFEPVSEVLEFSVFANEFFALTPFLQDQLDKILELLGQA